MREARTSACNTHQQVEQQTDVAVLAEHFEIDTVESLEEFGSGAYFWNASGVNARIPPPTTGRGVAR
jgi:hypothetical protein